MAVQVAPSDWVTRAPSAPSHVLDGGAKAQVHARGQVGAQCVDQVRTPHDQIVEPLDEFLEVETHYLPALAVVVDVLVHVVRARLKLW